MPRLVRLLAPLALIAMFTLLPATSSAAAPGAEAAKRCGVKRSEQRGLEATYVFRITVRRITCRGGKRLISSFNACRRRNGGRDGRCRRVSGYRCGERRFNKSRFSFDSNATCKRGGRSVSFQYQQNL